MPAPVLLVRSRLRKLAPYTIPASSDKFKFLDLGDSDWEKEIGTVVPGENSLRTCNSPRFDLCYWVFGSNGPPGFTFCPFNTQRLFLTPHTRGTQPFGSWRDRASHG